MACVLSGISGLVTGHLIRGRAGAERRAANPGPGAGQQFRRHTHFLMRDRSIAELFANRAARTGCQ